MDHNSGQLILLQYYYYPRLVPLCSLFMRFGFPNLNVFSVVSTNVLSFEPILNSSFNNPQEIRSWRVHAARVVVFRVKRLAEIVTVFTNLALYDVQNTGLKKIYKYYLKTTSNKVPGSVNFSVSMLVQLFWSQKFSCALCYPTTLIDFLRP